MRFASCVFCAFLFLVQVAAAQIGFQRVSIADPPGKPIAAAVWYPSSAKDSRQQLALFEQNVAPDGPITGTNLPVIFISHGTQGSLASHYDTALALAQAGFLAVAFTFTGDNTQDQSYVGNRIDLIDRPRQLKRVIAFMLDEWNDRAHLNPNAVGVFGFSLGAFAAFVEIGGVPDLARMAQLCRERPDAPECEFIKQNHGDQLDPTSDTPMWAHDARIRAAVIAAPAVSYLFGPHSLDKVKIPVQLWRGTLDTMAPDAWNSGVAIKTLPNPPDLHTVTDAGHMAFLAPCSDALREAAAFVCTDAPGFDRVAFHKQFNQDVIAFFSRTLLRPDVPK
jgi:predicted dienelactone hydrolase